MQGRPLHITITQGQRHESVAALELLEHARGRALLGDTGYDSNDFVAAIRERGMKAVIHGHPQQRHKRRRLDKVLYRERYIVEVFFHNLKRLRAVATRYEKTRRNYLALVQLGFFSTIRDSP